LLALGAGRTGRALDAGQRQILDELPLVLQGRPHLALVARQIFEVPRRGQRHG
jgi:hypothetical protein